MTEQVNPAPRAYQANVFWDRQDCATLSAQVYLASDADSYIDALHAEAEALLAENGRLSQQLAQSDAALRESRENDMTNVRTLEDMWERHDAIRKDLEAARGLLERAATCMRDAAFIIDSSSYRINGAAAAIYSLRTIAAELTATPAPEVPDHTEGNLEMAEQGELQEAVHWRAVLDPSEVPMQLNPHEHVAGFTNRRAAEDWIAARLQMAGWHYTLEALYPGPQPSQVNRIPAGLYAELEALRTLRDATGVYLQGYMRDEIEDEDSCSADQHDAACSVKGALDNARALEWKGGEQ